MIHRDENNRVFLGRYGNLSSSNLLRTLYSCSIIDEYIPECLKTNFSPVILDVHKPVTLFLPSV